MLFPFSQPGGTKRRLLLGLLTAVAVAGGVLWRAAPKAEISWTWSMGDKTIVIDAGHGGVDPGAVGTNQTLEKNVTLAVAKYLRNYVELGGAKAVMVREEDKDLGESDGLLQRKREDLARRIQLAADAQADVFISVHANSFPNVKLTGPQTFYHAKSPEGKALAQAIQQQLNVVAGTKRVAKGNQDLFILKKAHSAAVTVELGFLSNAEEEQKLNDPEYQQQLAWGIYQGLCRYLGSQAAAAR